MEEKTFDANEALNNADGTVSLGVEPPKELSFGQKLAGVSFNPSKDPLVDRVKAIFAELADIVHQQGDPTSDYLFNLIKGNALREILNAQMNTVKLLTLNK